MGTTEAELANLIDASQLLGTDGEPKSKPAEKAKATTKQPQPEPENDDQAPDEADLYEPEDAAEDPDDEEEESEDDGVDDPAIGRQAARREISELKRELEDLKAQLAGDGERAASAGKGGGAAAPPSEPEPTDEIGKALKAVKAKIAASKETWGELVEAVGLNDLVEALDKAREHGLSRAQQAAKEREEQEQNAKIGAANELHRIINTAARGNNDLMTRVGLGLHQTLKPKHIEARARIFAAAGRALEDSRDEYEAGTRSRPMTEREALLAGIAKVTGIKPSSAEAAAKERARMVRPEPGRSTEKADEKETHEQLENRLAQEADAFLQKFNR